MSTLRALVRNDWISIQRDPLLPGMLAMPVVGLILLLVAIRPAADFALQQFGYDLVPLLPVIASVLLLISMPVVFGAVGGFMLLDERDDDTLTALRVTPLSIAGYARYRFGSIAAVSFLYAVGTVALSQLAPGVSLLVLLVIGLSAAWLAPVVALMLGVLAANKVEGLAYAKAIGPLILAPLVASFVGEPLQWLFALLPTYWPAKALWEASAGGPWWLWAAGGAVYSGLVARVLYRRLLRRLG